MKRVVTVVTLLALVVLGGSLSLGQTPSSGTRRPIKIGVLEPLSGPLAVSGEFAKAGREVAFDEVGFTVAGRKVELIIEDTAFRPDLGITKMKKLVEQDKVDILLGPQNSAVALAIRDQVVSKGLPWILTIANTPSLTRERGAPNMFRPSFSAEQHQYPAGVFVREKLGYGKIAVVGLDYVAGRAEAGAFIEGFQAAGGKTIQEIWIPLGTPDAAPFITKIRPETIDALVIAGVWGGDAIRVIKALEEYGTKGRLPILATYAAVEEGIMLPALGKAALGIRSYGPYAGGLDTPENKRFVQAIRKKTGQPGNLEAYFGYIQGRVAVEALKAANGDIEDTERYLRALSRVELVGPAGPFKFDKNRNAILNLYFQEVRQIDGELRNVVIETIARGLTQR